MRTFVNAERPHEALDMKCQAEMLAGQSLGIKEVDDGIWLISFMQYDGILRPGAENPAIPRRPVRHEVSPMS